MNIIGIICEYNPFHNGHLYHIKKIKELYPNSLIILVLNGYFLQRGELSILSKEDKTKIALNYGVNIVVELPFFFGSQSADIFAFNAIKLLNELKVERIIFGSECNDIKLLENIVKKQEDKDYDEKVKELLDQGLNYPTAMSKALDIDFDFNNPNDLLGISYIKAINKINSKILYETIKRTNNYHDKTSNNNVISASNIRDKIKNNIDIKEFVPKMTYNLLKPINTDYFSILKYKIITDHNLAKYLTVDEGIENRLKDAIVSSNSLDELINNVKTKRYTYNKLNRMFIHILIGLTKEDIKKLELDYIKVLGFDELGQKYLNKIKKDIRIPFLNSKIDSKIRDYELKASLIYDLITRFNTYKFEINNKPIN